MSIYNEKMSLIDLFKIAHDNDILLSATIELLTCCNLKCEHCYIPEHNRIGLELEKIKNTIKDLHKLGLLNLTLTGGEIFLRKDLLDIVEYSRKLGIRVFLLSNATMIDEEVVSKISNLYISEFSTTLFSLNPLIHDSITKVDGSLENALNNINILKKYNIPIKIKTPLMRKNKDEYKEVIKFCKERNFEYLASPVIFSKLDGDKSPHNLRIHKNELKEIIKELDMMEAKKNKEFLQFYEEPCASIKYSLFIDCVGNVYPCNSFPYKIGNILKDNIESIWNSSTKKNIINIKKDNLAKCSKCKLEKFCERCPGLAFMENNDLLGCSDIAMEIASVRYDMCKVQ